MDYPHRNPYPPIIAKIQNTSVLKAIYLDKKAAKSTIRISLSENNTVGNIYSMVVGFSKHSMENTYEISFCSVRCSIPIDDLLINI